ncbi:LysR family transcriptional regulator [Vibrio sp. UCD-FRSSP16_10]|uniref:LysR family transcriptional regulator n=1 Tax=unclassified Vibrio TaxID=2614977 RepID=UPI0007FE34D5|nr:MULTISPECIES: LysR family transcriptional regulator [unclassified Vibrio]OBT12087.1 LysR family transcriptional regulator [Vibrio sp. UCD-FRSSP16_30]OBT20418.1 LysR family transcriptional regulator [Vibrio sp. UCD-FRSSP16_10]
MNFELKNLTLFLRVVEVGKIGRAGEDFGLSTTNASQRIQQLETDLGVKLFHRSTRTITLTHDGEVFLPHARRIVDDVEEVRNVFKGDDKNVQGRLKVAVSTSYGRHYLVPFIPELLELYPNLELEIDFSDRNVDLIEQGYDLAFRIGNLSSSNLLARRIADNPMLLVASPEYLKKYGVPQIPEDLLNHRCLSLSTSVNWELKDSDGKSHKISQANPISLNLGDAMRDLVEADMGIGMAAYWHAGPSLKAGRVVQVLPDYDLVNDSKIWAIRPPGKILPARVKVFLDFMEKKITETNKLRYEDLLK